MPTGQRLALEAGIGHEREFIRFWGGLSARGGRHGRAPPRASEEQVFLDGRAAAPRRRGRPPRSRTARGPSISTTGSRESFARASSAAGGGGVGDGEPGGRAARARVASVRPRQSSSGARPARPIATSSWPWRQARPKLSVMSTARLAPVSSRRRARSARAEASGSRGSTTTVSWSGALEVSTPALAHTKPWRVRQISTPRSARSTSAGLVEDHLHHARVLVALRRRARRRARAETRRRARPARPRPSRRPCGRSREHVPVARRVPSARAPPRSAPRGRRPGRTSGMLRQRAGAAVGTRARPARGAGVGGAPAGPARLVLASSARVRGARRRCRRAARAAPAGRRRCRCRAAARPGARRASAAPAASASARWRAKLPGPKLGSIASGATAAARWCRCRGGRGRPPPPAPPRPRRPAADLQLAGRRARGSRRGRTGPARSPPAARGAIPSEAAADWPASRLSSTTVSAPRRAQSGELAAGAVTMIVSSIAGVCGERVEHVGHHRAGELRARSCSATLGPEPLLGAPRSA